MPWKCESIRGDCVNKTLKFHLRPHIISIRAQAHTPTPVATLIYYRDSINLFSVGLGFIVFTLTVPAQVDVASQLFWVPPNNSCRMFLGFKRAPPPLAGEQFINSQRAGEFMSIIAHYPGIGRCPQQHLLHHNLHLLVRI